MVFQRCYSETEDECEHLRATSEETANRLQELATKHSELLEQINQLKVKLAETEKVHHPKDLIGKFLKAFHKHYQEVSISSL